MECQLRPLVYSLDLNNSPRIGFTPGKSRVKNLWRNKKGGSRCKMAGAGIQSFAKFRGQTLRIATTGITSWQTALKHTAECQPPLPIYCGMPTPWYNLTAECHRSNGSALKFSAECHKPRDRLKPLAFRGTHLTAELGKWPNSSTRHFTSTVPLFVTS
jgi:hypothetical protein